MHRWRIVSVVLAIALLGTNAWWLYSALVAGESDRAQREMLSERGAALSQLQKLAPSLANALSQTEVVALAKATTTEESYQKGGVYWVGSIGLAFDHQGKLVHVLPAWCCDDDIVDARDLGMEDAL